MSSDCGICGKVINSDKSEQKIKCAGSCDNVFHLRCVQEDVDGTKTRSFKDWKCRNCRAASTTTYLGMEGHDDILQELKDFKIQVFEELKSTRTLINTEISQLSDAMQFMSNKVDESTNLMKEIKSELAAVKKENESLRAMNTALDGEVKSLKDRVRSLEQYSRKNNIEISGIPETPKENVNSIVKDVGTALGVDLQGTDISTAHRVPSFRKDRPPPLIVQFARRSVRDTLINKFRERKVMTAQQINAALPAQNVYINEHLSPENKLFLSKLKQKCKDIGYNYAWSRDGKFFVRKCQGERYHRVDTYEELAKLK